jgi:NAD(P)H-hydrate epimerase
MSRHAANGVPALTRDQCRAADRFAIEQLGIPGMVLMENAGRNATDWFETWAAERGVARARAGVVCGKGNNGGDGFVIARHLCNRGWQVHVLLAAEMAELTGDAALNCAITRAMGIPIRELGIPGAIEAAETEWGQDQLLVDALLGTGFSGTVREPLAGIIARINRAGASAGGPLVVAVDVPSGLDADTGTASGTVVRAGGTVTFLADKAGYQKEAAREFLGRRVVVDIGAPVGLILERLGIASPAAGPPGSTAGG